ncbi:conserved domain protein [Coleofasciculus chthonoplastes PCC 7420]|uniref:Conserved domain protein n=2 Tax=Coleofasciculus chthonoplastes TaxID=64178 RepID=B4W501_9CYAN|nr:conserved domain protein [Coleofasciculus chthonoplastes PCC 7420]
MEMSWLSRDRKSVLILTLSTVLFLSVLPFDNPPAQAQSVGEQFLNLFRRERKQGRPSGRSAGTAIRDEFCFSGTSQPLTALVSADNLETTVAEYPTFWFYLPWGRSETVTQARFVLFDQNQRLVLDQTMVLPDAPGIVSVKLPETKPPLEVGKRYKWYFQVLCDEQERSRNPWVSSWVERVEASSELVRQLETLAESEQYRAYLDHGISQDVLTQLAWHRSVHEEDWRSLLVDYFELEGVADAAVTQLN